jgi:hypothetical protein
MKNRSGLSTDVQHCTTKVNTAVSTGLGPRVPGLAPVTTSSPIDQLAAVFDRWISNPLRANVTIEGVRLLQVMRILARPVYRLTELTDEADRLARIARCTALYGWEKQRNASRDAERSVNAAYSAILRDVDTLFTALTGVPADTLDALELRVPAKQLANDVRILLAVTR